MCGVNMRNFSGAAGNKCVFVSIAYSRQTHKNQVDSGTLKRNMKNTFQAIPSTFRCLEMHCILSGPIRFLSVRSSLAKLSLFEITRALVLFS